MYQIHVAVVEKKKKMYQRAVIKKLKCITLGLSLKKPPKNAMSGIYNASYFED